MLSYLFYYIAWRWRVTWCRPERQKKIENFLEEKRSNSYGRSSTWYQEIKICCGRQLSTFLPEAAANGRIYTQVSDFSGRSKQCFHKNIFVRNIHLRGVWKSQRTLPICISFTAIIDTTFDLFYLHTYVRYTQSLLISSIRQSNVFSFANLNADSSRGLVGVYGVEDTAVTPSKYLHISQSCSIWKPLPFLKGRFAGCSWAEWTSPS